jgi:hypothetical protein
VAEERLKRIGIGARESAVDTAIELQRRGLFQMAQDVLGNVGEQFLAALANEQNETGREQILRLWEKSCIRVQRETHVPGQLHLAVHGHDPDGTAASLFVPYVSALKSDGKTPRKILDVADTLMADTTLCGLIRTMIPFVPSDLLPEFRARMATCTSNSRPFLREWLSHPRTALDSRAPLACLLSSARDQGRELTIRAVTTAEETRDN